MDWNDTNVIAESLDNKEFEYLLHMHVCVDWHRIMDYFKKTIERFSRSGFSTKEQTLFAKRLAFLTKAGVPILESLHVLRIQNKAKSKQKIFDVMIDNVANGQYLSASLARTRSLFGDFGINIIRVGEMSGILSQNLDYLADELKKKQALRQKIISALMYPVFITVATLGVTGILTIYIFPKIMPIFQSVGVDLPFTTRALMALSAFLQNYGILFLFLVVGLVVSGGVIVKKVPHAHNLFDRFLLAMPLAGTISRTYTIANTCRTLGLLLKSGLPTVEALSISADTTVNTVYRAQFKKIADHCLSGGRIASELSLRPDLFPDMCSHMIAIGERTGNLPETLIYLSEMYEAELDDLTKNLSTSIEPLLMILMGFIVGFVAVSVITPIYEITQKLSH